IMNKKEITNQKRFWRNQQLSLKEAVQYCEIDKDKTVPSTNRKFMTLAKTYNTLETQKSRNLCICVKMYGCSHMQCIIVNLTIQNYTEYNFSVMLVSLETHTCESSLNIQVILSNFEYIL